MKMKKEENIFKELYENAPLGYQSLNEDGFLIHVNDAEAEIFGYKKEEMIGKYFGDLLIEEEKKQFYKNFPLFKKLGKTQIIFNMLKKDGDVIKVSFDGRIAYNDDGTFKKTHCILKDITSDFIYQEKIKANERKMDILLNSTEEGIYGVDINERCNFVNQKCLELLGYSNEEEIIGKDMHELIHHSYENGEPFLKENCEISHSFKYGIKLKIDNDIMWRKNGTYFYVSYASNPLIRDGKILGAVLTFRDNTENIKHEKALIEISYTDYLTELNNRRYYETRIQEIDKSENYPLTLIVGDINGLKLINDSFGHDAGDKLLTKVSSILKELCDEAEFIARMGGDEFVIVFTKMDSKSIEKIISLTNKRLENEFINGLKISVAFGYYSKVKKEENINQIYEKAENAMYQEKLLRGHSVRSDSVATILKVLNEKDNYSESHSRTVSRISERLAKYANLNRHEIQEIKTAGLLHDIGKIIIPSEILNKNGKLTDKEYEIMKSHPEIGFRILKSARNMLNMAEIVLYHHERWDGFGYPAGIREDEIPYQSRIITIADAFDAMTNDRTYKNKISYQEAIEELKKCAGTQFDPELIKIVIENFHSIVSIK